MEPWQHDSTRPVDPPEYRPTLKEQLAGLGRAGNHAIRDLHRKLSPLAKALKQWAALAQAAQAAQPPRISGKSYPVDRYPGDYNFPGHQNLDRQNRPFRRR